MKTRIAGLFLSLLCFTVKSQDIIGTNAINWNAIYSMDGGATWTNFLSESEAWTNVPIYSTNVQIFYRTVFTFTGIRTPPPVTTNTIVFLSVFASTNCDEFPPVTIPPTNRAWGTGRVIPAISETWTFVPIIGISNVVTFNDLCTNCDSLIYEQQQDALFSDDDWWIIEPPEEF